MKWREHFELVSGIKDTNIRKKEQHSILNLQEQKIEQNTARIKLGKAAGIDKIVPEIIKETAKEAFETLLNEVMKTTKVPSTRGIIPI